MKRRTLYATLAAPGVLWLVLLYLIPVIILVITAFSSVDIVGRPQLGDWRPENLTRVFQPIYIEIIIRSIIFALIATAIAAVIGYIVAYTIARFGGRYKNFLVILVVLPWFVDYLIRVYAWVQILSDDGILSSMASFIGIDLAGHIFGTPVAIVIGLVYSYLPFMILPIYLVLEQLDNRLIEAGRDLYHSNFRTFRFVTLPLSLSAVITGSTVVFIFSFTDFVIPTFLGSPQYYMVGNLIQDQFQGVGALPFGAAVTVIMLLIIVVVMGLISLLATLKNVAARRKESVS